MSDKFEIGQVIFYLKDNRVHSAPILAIMDVKNLHEDWACTKEQVALWTPFGPAGLYYHTVHGALKEGEIFATREKLAQSLLDPEELEAPK